MTVTHGSVATILRSRTHLPSRVSKWRLTRSRFALAHGVARWRAVAARACRSPDDATIVHALNRLGFGPRPGDVDRVRQVGLSPWIDRQLHPDRIADDAVAARLAGMPTLRMTSQEIAKKYLQPLLDQRQQRRRQAEAPPGH